jgi:hypothetical protein
MRVLGSSIPNERGYNRVARSSRRPTLIAAGTKGVSSAEQLLVRGVTVPLWQRRVCAQRVARRSMRRQLLPPSLVV